MINKTIVASAAFLFSIPMSVLAETASELIEKHTKQAAESIEAYLQKNPNAADANEATDFLIESYARLKMTERQAELLGGKYKKLAKGADLIPQEFFGVFQEMFALHMASGAKDKARTALASAKKIYRDIRRLNVSASSLTS